MGRVKELLDLHEGSTDEEVREAMNRRAQSLLDKEYRNGVWACIIFQSCLVILAFVIVNYLGG